MKQRIDAFVSVVAPLHDDAAIVVEFVDETLQVLRASFSAFELVLVDDGSTDDTIEQLEPLLSSRECLRLLRLSRRFGVEAAISAGLDSVIGDYVVVMQPAMDPPALIPSLVRRARAGRGIVSCVRVDRSRDRLTTRVASRAFHWFAARVLKIDLPRDATQFRVLDRQAINAVLRMKERCRYMRVLSTHIGYRNETFEYTPINRDGTVRRRSFADGVRLALDVTVTGSRRPLRLVSWFGVFASLVNLAYTGYVIVVYIVKDEVAEGWTTLSLQISMMFLFMFVLLTVISEYIGHILAETQGRPLYHLLEERNSSVTWADTERRNVVPASDSPTITTTGRAPAGGAL